MNRRFKAIETAQNRAPIFVQPPDNKISSYFGCNVFDDQKMERHLSSDAFKQLKESITSGASISPEISDQVAVAMKTWATSRGVTHFTHWFHPLTGMTAEKHDSFFTVRDGRPIEEFEGKALFQQIPNASGFPTGGLRSTFEARGYTMWDSSSPAFIMEIGSGKTLFIPTIFLASTGVALDYKSPLLKSITYLNKHAVEVSQLFDRFITKVTPKLGCEQEFFLLDDALFNARPDLVMTGRTLVGELSAKGQELNDHYFGSIPERIYSFLLDLEQNCHKVGIPIRTRHNETAPSQFEIVPEFEEVNISVDHNQLLMDLLKRTSKRHGLRVLLHEKPFEGINGSAKHNNWSLHSNTGKNLLSPGETPRKNMLFLTFLVNTIKAIHDFPDVIRASIASAGNDQRLGRGGAPPADISLFIGEGLTKVLQDIEKLGDDWMRDENRKQELKMDIHNKIPEFLLDITDNNRTSPIAFTGNKFELRIVGAGHNSASPMIVMNTIVGQQLKAFKQRVDGLVKEKKLKKDTAILNALRETIKESKTILFEGDNYDLERKKTLEKQKKQLAKDTPNALDAYLKPSSIKLFEDAKVLMKSELLARRENLLVRYSKQYIIDAKAMIGLVRNFILPAVFRYQNELIDFINKVQSAKLKPELFALQNNLLESISKEVNTLFELIEQLDIESKNVENTIDIKEQADNAQVKIIPLLRSIRSHVNYLEQFISDDLWPIPKLSELLHM